VGRATHSPRAAEVGSRGFSGYGRKVHGAVDPPSPSQSWRTFLANHVQQIAAADFFVVPTATCRLLFVLSPRVVRASPSRGRGAIEQKECSPFLRSADSITGTNVERHRLRRLDRRAPEPAALVR
jgi:hypothetical protein